MHNHLTEPQLLIVGFALLLALIFGLAAMLESRPGRSAPFRGFFCAGFDRELFVNASSKNAQPPDEDQITIFPDIDAAYLDSLGMHADASDASQVKLE